MSKEEFVSVTIPKKLFDIATRLGTVKIGDVEIKLHSERMIVKEALARGLKLMVMERFITDKMAEEEVVESIYTSLVILPAEEASENAGKREKLREALAQLTDVEKME